VWRINQGKYANPVIADEARVYVTGRSNVYAFRDKRRRRP
jgi:hypothetical protein